MPRAKKPGTSRQRGYPGIRYALITEPQIPIRLGIAWRQGDASPILERFLRVASEVTALANHDVPED